MDDGLPRELEGRILLLPPTKRDAGAAVHVFEAVGMAVTICGDIAEICTEIGRGAAVAIVPDEAILNDRAGCLARLLKEQPPWSDLPLIVLTPPHRATESARRLESIGPVTLVPRPVEIRSLASTVHAALRDRRRQYARREDFAALERHALSLRENDRHKDEFLAMLAHELRNPLAAVNNAVNVLKMSPDAESRDWASDVVGRQVKQLVRLIDDLLDVSRITSGKIRLTKDFLDASSILDLAIESARPLLDERGHTLRVSIDRGHLPLHVDATRVEQIVLNLLTNAAKYTRSGGRIWLTAVREGDRAVISVRDDGTGIAPDKLPEMFQLFTQGDRSLDRSEGGLGIGLTVVQRLTEMHGGSVTARSEGLDRGSEFVVSLPLARRPSAESANPVHEGPSVGGRACRILVVDDNVDTAQGMSRLLKLIGHEVEMAHDGPAAIELAREFRPEFILLDIGLPGMSGYEVARTLRREAWCKGSVIVAASGYGQEEDRRRSKEAGFDHHLIKPLDHDALFALLAEGTGPPSA